jgi:osmoprotectant transport system permease protein
VIAGGGLGRFIIDGYAQQNYPEVFGGAVLVGLLALATEVGLSAAERVLVPRGIRLLRRPASRRVATFKTA